MYRFCRAQSLPFSCAKLGMDALRQRKAGATRLREGKRGQKDAVSAPKGLAREVTGLVEAENGYQLTTRSGRPLRATRLVTSKPVEPRERKRCSLTAFAL